MDSPLKRAARALEDGDLAMAISLASGVIERRPDHARAYLLRSQARYAAGNVVMGMADLLDGLAADPRPQVAVDLETTLFDRLSDALKNGWGELNLAAKAADGLSHRPRIFSALALLAAMLAHDASAVAEALTRLGTRDLPLFSARLAARLHLNFGDTDKAIIAFEQSEARKSRQGFITAELEPIIAYRQQSQAVGHRHLARHRLAICSVLRNEGDNLAEWIVYHAELGVGAFYLYDNESTDETPHILDRLSREFKIIHHLMPEQPAQLLAYQHFLTHHRLEAEWAAFIDGDEFLQPETGRSLSSIVERGSRCGAIAANWMVFGSAGHRTTPTSLCIEAFNRRAADNEPVNGHVKSIVRPANMVRYTGPHQQLIVGQYEDPNGAIVFPLATRVWPPHLHGLRVNHYAVKSQEQALRKIERGRPMAGNSQRRFRDSSYITKFDINTVEDTSAAVVAPAIRKTLAQLELPAHGNSQSGDRS